MEEVVLFGTGEIAKLAHYYFKHDKECDYEVVAFTADDEFVEDDTFNGCPLVPFSEVTEQYPPSEVKGHVALSYRKLNQTRAEKYREMKGKGYELVSYVCSRSVSWPDLSVGDNCLILENQTIQPTVKIGDNVMIWSGNHLGHGCKIDDHVYISSHVCISGHTEIGERCFLGVNSTFADFIEVGERVFVAMDASVTENIQDDAVVLGAQGSVLGPDENLAQRLKKKYFGV
jgi:sugar O-acyltransferase (sialic acid O-acetyltransferase NeuD family)